MSMGIERSRNIRSLLNPSCMLRNSSPEGERCGDDDRSLGMGIVMQVCFKPCS